MTKEEEVAELEQDLVAAILANDRIKKVWINAKIRTLTRQYSDADILKTQLMMKMRLLGEKI
jgi:hypothetical protein